MTNDELKAHIEALVRHGELMEQGLMTVSVALKQAEGLMTVVRAELARREAVCEEVGRVLEDLAQDPAKWAVPQTMHELAAKLKGGE